jgi:8-oxo-dGTP pyrophosphatase MutT (NUDIX family)
MRTMPTTAGPLESLALPAWWQALAERAAQPPLRPRSTLHLEAAPGAPAIGSIEPALAAQLRDAGLPLRQRGADECVVGEPDVALERIARWLHGAGIVRRGRDELLPVSDARDAAGAALARIERGAVRPLGIATFAVHLIAFTPHGKSWVQQRALDKATDPGQWDTLVGGLVAAQESTAEALERETWEEAGLRLPDLRELRQCGRLTIRRPVSEGYMVEHIDVFEAVVPDGTTPHNEDGEVERFECLAPEVLAQHLAEGRFTLEAALMLAASLRRCRLL